MRHPAIEDLAILRATLRPATAYPKHDHSPASRRPAGYFALHWDTIDGGEIEIVDKGGTDLGALVSVGTQDVFGYASGATVFAWATRIFESGGTVRAPPARTVTRSNCLVEETAPRPQQSPLAAFPRTGKINVPDLK